jgi:hypothetical protein
MQLNAVSTVNALSHTGRHSSPDCTRGLRSPGFASFEMKLMPEHIGRATAVARGAIEGTRAGRKLSFNQTSWVAAAHRQCRSNAMVNTASNSHKATGRYQ